MSLILLMSVAASQAVLATGQTTHFHTPTSDVHTTDKSSTSASISNKIHISPLPYVLSPPSLPTGQAFSGERWMSKQVTGASRPHRSAHSHGPTAEHSG
ncbi:hypothetical protein QBC35DRAFT_486849 [Podospora australis]|uniref:Uncharacterized protein n=1 Tax=Podospora australis TaxID=1536484 RepID=A0AAN7ALM0_9PEZI|nr:hypothetical protein QBC35DRAFT_486849 [Podospora australis]